MTYLYLEHVSSALTNNTLYREHPNWENWAMYEIQSPKLPNVFEPLPDFVAGALGIMNQEPPTKAVLDFDK